MKGNWSGFLQIKTTGGSNGGSDYTSGVDFNSAGSNSVGKVESITTLANSHSLPTTAAPNSVIKNYKEGKLNSERYYGEDGRAYLDIDYTNHGNPSTHPHVPHEHSISFDEHGKMHRGKEKEINND